MGWHAVPQVWQRRRQRVCQDHAHAIRHEHIRQGQSSWDGRTNTGDTGRERRAARQYRVVLHCHCMHAACTNVEPAPCRRSEQSTMVTVPALPHGCLSSQANTLGYTMRYYDASIWDETGEGAHGEEGGRKLGKYHGTVQRRAIQRLCVSEVCEGAHLACKTRVAPGACRGVLG